MNLFQVVFLDVVLLMFPILVFLIYLCTNKNINIKDKGIYYNLALITSFYLTFKYGISTPKILPILVLNSIVILAYLKDKYILANFFSILIIFIYRNEFNLIYMFILVYILFGILYVIKCTKKLNNIIYLELFVFFSSLVYFIWIYIYNNMYFDLYDVILIIISYVFIVNIFYLMYSTGVRILDSHIKFKELQKEKQIRLSLFKITHEIKNPIAVCKGYLDMINVDDSKQVKKYIPIIKSEIERLLSLLQDFLLINKSNLDIDIMDINMLVEDTLDKLKPLLNENNINVNLNFVDDEIYINGDYNRLSQVIINIVKNSIEAIPEGKIGIIDINTKIENNKYLLTIEDNGIGMNKETISKMKEPFFTTKKRGSGLGVSLIYEIMDAHDGKVEYESEFGHGTKVKLEFPLYK